MGIGGLLDPLTTVLCVSIVAVAAVLCVRVARTPLQPPTAQDNLLEILNSEREKLRMEAAKAFADASEIADRNKRSADRASGARGGNTAAANAAAAALDSPEDVAKLPAAQQLEWIRRKEARH